MMQKRHYELLALIMRDANEKAKVRPEVFDRILESLNKALKQDNPSFDEKKFREACLER
jgi:hypothetical protein